MRDQISIAASLAAIDHGQHVTQYRGLKVLKFDADLRRYERLIAQTRPEVIVETGTHQGGSARWFADQLGVGRVITIDCEPSGLPPGLSLGIDALVVESSTLPEVVADVAARVAGLRTMVVLDSDHAAPHVMDEIDAYGPLVTPGCALVVEDGLFDFATPDQLARHSMSRLTKTGGPNKAIALRLHGNSDWRPATGLDVDSQLTQNVDGWWIRRD